jgi:KUP system potassium uptake protein
VSAEAAPLPHVAIDEQLGVDDLGRVDDGIVHLSLRYGFFDIPDIPAALARAAATEPLLAGIDTSSASYFVSRASLRRSGLPGMAGWRKRLFIAMAHNAADHAEIFRLPGDRTVVMGTIIDV